MLVLVIFKNVVKNYNVSVPRILLPSEKILIICLIKIKSSCHIQAFILSQWEKLNTKEKSTYVSLFEECCLS